MALASRVASRRQRTALAAVAGLALLLPLLVVAGPVSGDTRSFRDPTGPRGSQDLAHLEVDNTGNRLSVTARTDGTAWHGTVRMQLDVRGKRGFEYVATTHHSPRPGTTYRTSAGHRWRCPGLRTMRSRAKSTLSRLNVPRGCLDGAPKLRVRVTTLARHARNDIATSRAVLQQSRPNILMLMVDDMRNDDLQYMPHVRSLIADHGVTFANSFAPYPLCCPARASVMTGLYAHNHHVWSHKTPYGFHVFDDNSTIATWLHAAEYHTSYLGKYLNGYGTQPRPGRTTGHSTQYVPPGWDLWRGSIDGGLPSSDPNSGGTYRYFDTTLNDNGHGYLNFRRHYQTGVYGRLGSHLVRNDALSDHPFFDYISFSAPHHGRPLEPDDPGTVQRSDGTDIHFRTPARPAWVEGALDRRITSAPGEDWSDEETPDQRAAKPQEMGALLPPDDAERAGLLELDRQRAEALVVADKAIARIMAALTDTGELEETLVVFTSDNGYFLGEQNIRQGKILPYEPSLRTPTLMRGPGIPAGQVRNDPFLSIDFAPTFAKLAGVRPTSQVDGKSMLRVARNGSTGWKRIVLTETGPKGVVRDTDETGEPLSTSDPGQPDQRYIIGVRTNQYLYTNRANGEEELYDVTADPDEYDNLIGQSGYAHVADQLRTQLHRIRACDGRECRRRHLPDGLATGP